MSTTANPALYAELQSARAVHVGATRQAAKTWRLLQALMSCRVWLDEEKAIREATSSIFYSTSYSACEDYSDVDEFSEVLAEQLRSTFPREVVNGQAVFRLNPFFHSESTLLRHMGLCSVAPSRLAEFSELDVQELELAPPVTTSPVIGVSALELQVLIAAYSRESLKLVNAMRKLRTSLAYLQRTLTEDGRAHIAYSSALQKDDALAAIAALVEACDLPFVPAPCAFFSSGSDKTNVLHSLEQEAGKDYLKSAALGP